MLNIFIYICTEYILDIQYKFAYLASLHEPLQYNTIEYIYGHYRSLMRIDDTLVSRKKFFFRMAYN